MKYYIVLTSIHAKRISQELADENIPKSDLTLLAQQLNATFVTPEAYPIKLVDRLRGKLASTPENWAFARNVADQFNAEDVLFFPGEEIGVPFASICAQIPQSNRPKLVVWFHRITGPKSRLVLKLLRIGDVVNYAVVCSRLNQSFLINHLKMAKQQVLFWWYPINTTYFAPRNVKLGSSHASSSRPLIVSCGLEQRDYCLLADATRDLNLDVKIAGFSQFQSVVSKTFPRVMPANMSNRRYKPVELLELYHDADLIVLSLRENNGTSGVTVLTEAMACGKPIVCTRTTGLKEYFDDEGLMTVEPANVGALREAIVHLLNNAAEAKLLAKKARSLACSRHDLAIQVQKLAKHIKSVTVSADSPEEDGMKISPLGVLN